MDDGRVLPWLTRPGARSWACASPAAVRDGEVRAYHASLPGYAPTPLAEVPALAAELGAGRVFVKDESARLRLPAFKVLGASWAVRQVLAGPGPDRAAPPPGLAGARAALTGKGSADRRAALAVDSASVIVLLSTEAGTAG